MLTAAGGLVFIADLNGQVVALDPQSGAVKWHGKVKGAVGGGVVSYGAGGAQRSASPSPPA